MQKQLAHWTKNKTQILIFCLIGLYLLLFLPFWEPVLLGFLFAAACEPIVNAGRRRLHAKRTKMAYLTVGVGLTFFIALLAVVMVQGFTQVYDLFQSPEAMGDFNAKILGVRDSFLGWANQQSFLEKVNVKDQLDRVVISGTNTAKGWLLVGAQAFLTQTPEILLNLFIFICAFGAFLVIQPRIWATTSQALQLGDRGKEHFKRFEKICGLALGSVLITGFVQSILVVIGAMIGGFGSPFMIFGVTFLFALIPILGAGVVPIFLCLFGLIEGNIAQAIILGVTAAIVGVADNVLRAWLFSRAAESNPILSLISLLGGIALFGFSGLFIAPVIEQLVMTYAFSDDGEPAPGTITPAKEPAHPDQFVSNSRSSSQGSTDDFVPSPS
jgi:predicted PurR-regulated permease PerM